MFYACMLFYTHNGFLTMCKRLFQIKKRIQDVLNNSVEELIGTRRTKLEKTMLSSYGQSLFIVKP